MGKERKAKLALSSLTQPKVHKREMPAHQLRDPDTARTKSRSFFPRGAQKAQPCRTSNVAQPHTESLSFSPACKHFSIQPAGSCAGRNTKQPAAFFSPTSSHLNPPPPGHGCTAAPVHRFRQGCLKPYPCSPIKRDPMHYYPTSQQFQPHCFQADTFLSKRQKIEKKNSLQILIFLP